MEQAHIPLLKVFDDLKFNLGKRTLLDYLKGDLNPTIERNNLEELNSYGCLYMLEKGVILDLIEQLIRKSYLEIKVVGSGFQVIERTSLGIKEIFERNFYPKDFDNKIKINKFKSFFKEDLINDENKKLFDSFSFFLEKFNDKQKKAIVESSKNILCVAGAGSGKTTVLTKRIEFLTKFKGVNSKKVLAITFTKKAKQEMEHRLNDLGIINLENKIKVETFNSFCEKYLKKYGNKIYSSEVKVCSYRDKISIVSKCLEKLGVSFDSFYDNYFNKRQLKERSRDDLFFLFVNDVFSIIDYYKNTENNISNFYEKERNSTNRRVAQIMCDLSKLVNSQLKKNSLRDFSDQIIDCLKLFRENKDLIPELDHLLIDEFQDVNLVQFELIKLLNSKNIFAVGDPRQAIYGWRGSDVNFILNFPKNFVNTCVISLDYNYRSNKDIVDFSNKVIKNMGLNDMKSGLDNDSQSGIYLIEQDNELLERRFVLEAIKNSKSLRNEIFVLARTNKVLESYADFFSQNGVNYTIKSEEEYRNGEPKENEVVLATVHSIKGMEANEVYLVSCNSLSFPNKVVDNFVFSLMKDEDSYDKNSEELRLFYVALTRAKNKLVLSYTGNYSKFISDEMLSMLSFKEKNKNLFDYASNSKSKSFDNSNSVVLKNMIKSWRSEKARSLALAAYMIISNQAIEDLIKLRPQSRVELYQVNGLGEVKIAKYGDEILKVING